MGGDRNVAASVRRNGPRMWHSMCVEDPAQDVTYVRISRKWEVPLGHALKSLRR